MSQGFNIEIPSQSDVVLQAERIVKNREKLDRAMLPFLSNWRRERIGVCIKLILRMALWKLQEKETPATVVINVAIELAKIVNQTYFEKLNGILRAKNLHNHWYILTGNRDLWPLLKRVHLFVRPTLSDGASVSIQEALFFVISVVASDVCERPNQVILFKSRNVLDFTEKVICALERSGMGLGIKRA